MTTFITTIYDPDNLGGAAMDYLVERDGDLALHEWAQVVDLGPAAHMDVLLTRSVATAGTSVFTGNVFLNPDYFKTYFDQDPDYVPGDAITVGAQEYPLLHEEGHRVFGPAFSDLVHKTPQGLVFTGVFAAAAYGAPPPVTNDDQYAHFSRGNDSLATDLMSGVQHDDRLPQSISKVDAAAAYDLGHTPPVQLNPELVGLYVADFGRAPDADGVAYWQAQLRAGVTIETVAASFAQQPEHAAGVAAAYQNALGRAPDAAGAAYWQGELDAGRTTQAGLVLALMRGAQGQDAHYLANREAVGAYYAGWGLDNAAEGREIMSHVDVTDASLAAAKHDIDHYAVSVVGLADIATLGSIT